MKLWIFTPAAAIGAAAFLALVSPSPVDVAVTPAVQVAALQSPDIMTDACVYSVEAEAAQVDGSCGASMDAGLSRDAGAFTWPGDFIDVTVGAAAHIWTATLQFIGSIYQFAASIGSMIG